MTALIRMLSRLNASLGLAAQQLYAVLGMWLDCSF